VARIGARRATDAKKPEHREAAPLGGFLYLTVAVIMIALSKRPVWPRLI